MELPDRFMVIDDDATNNLLCRFVLKRFCPSATVAVFNRCTEALAFITAEANASVQVTTLFLDINMDEMSGWDFLEAFKGLSPEVHNQYRIYMLSSSLDARDKIRAEQNPFICGLIAKPLTTVVLAQLFHCAGIEVTTN